jgi:hypothetical protein
MVFLDIHISTDLLVDVTPNLIVQTLDLRAWSFSKKLVIETTDILVCSASGIIVGIHVPTMKAPVSI